MNNSTNRYFQMAEQKGLFIDPSMETFVDLLGIHELYYILSARILDACAYTYGFNHISMVPLISFLLTFDFSCHSRVFRKRNFIKLMINFIKIPKFTLVLEESIIKL